MATNLFKKMYQLYQDLFYIPALLDPTWSFEHENTQLGQLAANLRELGLSPTYIGRHLNEMGINETFQSVIQRDGLADRVVLDTNNLSLYPHNRVFSADEKERYLAEQIAKHLKQ